jgi:hypothetical protein
MRFTTITSLLFVIFLPAAASAQQVIRNFDQDTIFRSMQCEVGLFGLAAKKAGLPATMQAHIKYSTSGTDDGKVSAEAGFGGLFGKILQGPKLSGAYDFARVDSSTLEGKLNLHEGNRAACIGKQKAAPAIPLNINECLTKGLPALQGGFAVSCSRKVTAKATFDASGKFVVWVVTVGPELSWDHTVTYQIDVDAPAKSDEKKTASN